MAKKKIKRTSPRPSPRRGEGGNNPAVAVDERLGFAAFAADMKPLGKLAARWASLNTSTKVKWMRIAAAVVAAAKK